MPIQIKLPDGRTISAPDDATPEELDAIANDAAGPDPEPSQASAPRHPYATPPLNSMTKEQKVEHFMNDPFLKGAATGGVTTGSLVKKVGDLGRRVAEPVMDMAFGAQAAVKNKFPTVNLSRVALREGVGATNAAKASRLGKEAARAVPAAGRAADAAGAAPVTARQVIGDLRPVFDRAQQAKRGGISEAPQSVMNVVRRLRKEIPSGGLSREDALVAKSEWQRLAKPALHGQPGELASMDPRAAQAVAGSFAKHSRAGAEGIGSALDRAQELMALERATKSASGRQPLLRMLLGATAGAGAGALSGDVTTGLMSAAIPMLAMSPRGLSAAARGIYGSAEPASEALIRALMASHEQEQ
jgi:hypothetical protein